jgi:hypothetical protein
MKRRCFPVPKVQDLARYVRSKAAGPFWVTLEIFCDNDEAYQSIKGSANISKKTVAKLYGVDAERVKEFVLDDLRVIKYSYPRPYSAGYRYENDMHSGQQFVRLAEVEV